MSDLSDYQELARLQDVLDAELKAMREAGYRLAQDEAAYRVALRKAILAEREKGTPVTIISDVCRGREDIANLRCSRDCSEALYEASRESIHAVKLNIRTLSAQIDREWSRAL